jgi:hypothetical protein
MRGGASLYIEVKRPGEYATPEQRQYIDECIADGCLAGVAHSVREAIDLVEKWRRVG